jgi:phenylacetate-CoA ligase
VIVEIIKDGKSAMPGEIGDIVMTDIRNKAMPLIRYKIDDKGMLLDTLCSCGRPTSLMKPCAGRSSEYITLPDGRTLSPYLFTTMIEHVKGLLQYQIVQTGTKNLMVNAVVADEKQETAPHEINKIIRDVTSHSMNVAVNICDKIDIEKNGKYKVVKNLCNTGDRC